MKARVKSSGEIVEVKKWQGSSDVIYSTLDMNNFYQHSDLDFNVEAPQTGATIKGWIARDEDNTLEFYRNEIKKGRFYWGNIDPSKPTGESLILPNELFPQITWESEPCEVDITIKIKEK